MKGLQFGSAGERSRWLSPGESASGEWRQSPAELMVRASCSRLQPTRESSSPTLCDARTGPSYFNTEKGPTCRDTETGCAEGRMPLCRVCEGVPHMTYIFSFFSGERDGKTTRRNLPTKINSARAIAGLPSRHDLELAQRVGHPINQQIDPVQPRPVFPRGHLRE